MLLSFFIPEEGFLPLKCLALVLRHVYDGGGNSNKNPVQAAALVKANCHPTGSSLPRMCMRFPALKMETSFSS